jgi:predicted GTPase
MGKSVSRPQASQIPADQRSFTETRQFVAEHGVDGIGVFYREQLDAWRHVKLNFLVTGASGSGKSTFINAIRG